jgi:hypothetical protein
MKRANGMILVGMALALTLGTNLARAGDGGSCDPAAQSSDYARPCGTQPAYPSSYYPGYYPPPYPPPYPYYSGSRVDVVAVPFSPGTMTFVQRGHVTVLRPGWD